MERLTAFGGLPAPVQIPDQFQRGRSSSNGGNDLVKTAYFVVAAIACLICAGCARQPGQPDPVSMAKEMTGEFGTFVVDVKDEAVDRMFD